MQRREIGNTGLLPHGGVMHAALAQIQHAVKHRRPPTLGQPSILVGQILLVHYCRCPLLCGHPLGHPHSASARACRSSFCSCGCFDAGRQRAQQRKAEFHFVREAVKRPGACIQQSSRLRFDCHVVTSVGRDVMRFNKVAAWGDGVWVSCP